MSQGCLPFATYLIIAIVHKGPELQAIEYGDFGSPAVDQFTSLARNAVAKMPAT